MELVKTSCHGNASLITDTLWGESNVHRFGSDWITLNYSRFGTSLCFVVRCVSHRISVMPRWVVVSGFYTDDLESLLLISYVKFGWILKQIFCCIWIHQVLFVLPLLMHPLMIFFIICSLCSRTFEGLPSEWNFCEDISIILIALFLSGNSHMHDVSPVISYLTNCLKLACVFVFMFFTIITITHPQNIIHVYVCDITQTLPGRHRVWKQLVTICIKETSKIAVTGYFLGEFSGDRLISPNNAQ